VNRQALETRASRVIAAYRVVMAALFALWIWLEPDQPARGGAAGYVLLVAYIGLALVMVPIAWNHWWLEYRLTLPVYMIDGSVFVAALYFTQTGGSEFFAPFFVFFAFMLLSAAMRWKLSIALAAAAVLSLSYLLIGFAFTAADAGPDPTDYLRRFSYMAVLSLIIIWYALQRSVPRVPHFTPKSSAVGSSPLAQALDFAIAATGASGAAIAWADEDEPRTTLQLAGSLGEGVAQLAPDALTLEAAGRPTLFDADRLRSLVFESENGPNIRPTRTVPRFAAYLNAPWGMTLPLEGNTGRGQLLLTGISGMSRDDLAFGQILATEITRGIDEEEAASLAREAAVARTRANLARDLHDSVAQSLAGTLFRLQSLRTVLTSGGDPNSELEAIIGAIRDEQGHLRTIIDRLRRDELAPGSRNLSTELAFLLDALSRQWRIKARLVDGANPPSVPAWLVFEVQQLVREALANAARHGGAREVEVRVEASDGILTLAICDDGSGVEEGAELFAPRSIAERVAALGGTLSVDSRPGDTRIEVNLPYREAP
jgi:signal transduction histidine kinase